MRAAARAASRGGFTAATGNLRGAWNPGANSNVYALAFRNGIVYVGGLFNFAGGQPRTFAAALDTATGAATSWNPAPNGAVNTMACADSVVYLGGGFTTVADRAQSRRGARHHLGALLPGIPRRRAPSPGLVVDDTTVYAGGNFSTIGGQVRSRLAALSATTGLATSWNPSIGLNGDVAAIVPLGDTVYVGGAFTSYTSGTTRYQPCTPQRRGAPPCWRRGTPPRAEAWSRSPHPAPHCTPGGFFLSVGGVRRANMAALDLATGRATAFGPIRMAR